MQWWPASWWMVCSWNNYQNTCCAGRWGQHPAIKSIHFQILIYLFNNLLFCSQREKALLGLAELQVALCLSWLCREVWLGGWVLLGESIQLGTMTLFLYWHLSFFFPLSTEILQTGKLREMLKIWRCGSCKSICYLLLTVVWGSTWRFLIPFLPQSCQKPRLPLWNNQRPALQGFVAPFVV